MKIEINDGENLIVMVPLKHSLHDPALQYPYVCQAYRVVANSYGPTLVLVPLKSEPTLVSSFSLQASPTV